MQRFFAVMTLGALALGLCGCNQGVTVGLVRGKGKVIYKGKGVADAVLTFLPEGEGSPAGATTDSEGNFTINTQGRAGAAKGKYFVGIFKAAAGAAMKDPKPEDLMKINQAQMSKKKVAATAAPKSEIPLKYRDAKASGLTVTIVEDASKNDFEFALSD